MMLKFQCGLVVVLVLLYGQLSGQNKELIGCYQSWKWQQDKERLDPQNIPYDKLTIINYAFFYPLANGDIVGMDPVADRYLLKGESPDGSGEATSSRSIIALANRHGTKVVLSVGGWETSNNFPQVAADPQKRASFAQACISLIQEYGFDGIDVDWEFPGYKRHNGTDQDRFNFTLLLQSVRDSLDALEKISARTYLLTASLPAAASHLPDIEVRKITALLDYLNIMTYDLYGSWGKMSNHNSALYGPAQGDSARCLDGAFKLYQQQHGVPAEKITLTAVFFGYSYAHCPDIYSEHQGMDTLLFKKGQDILYAHVAEKSELFERHWDSKAQAPYLISRSQTLVSLDDERSVALKADYIIKNNAAGLTIWPLQGDYLKDGKTPLLDTIHKKFYGK